MTETERIPGLNPQKDGSFAMQMEVPNGNLRPDIIKALQEVSAIPGITVHITTAQKIMFLGMDVDSGRDIMAMMEAAGASIRKGGTLSHARTCVGKPWCKYAWRHTFELGDYLYANVGRELTAPKMKIGISGCPACCSWANIMDLGFVGVKSGWKVFVGGHGGALPCFGTELTRVTTHEEAADLTLRIARLFTENVKKKARVDRMVRKLGGFDALKKELGVE